MVTYSWHRGRLAALVAGTGVAVALLAAGPAFADSINFTYSTAGTYTVTRCRTTPAPSASM
jgi:hypothetical protein